jgi:hypothetical protein
MSEEDKLADLLTEEERRLVKGMSPAVAAGFVLARRKAELEAALNKDIAESHREGAKR